MLTKQEMQPWGLQLGLKFSWIDTAGEQRSMTNRVRIS